MAFSLEANSSALLRDCSECHQLYQTFSPRHPPVVPLRPSVLGRSRRRPPPEADLDCEKRFSVKDGLKSAVRLVVRRFVPRLAYPVLAGPLRGARFVLGSLAGAGAGASVYVNRVEPGLTTTLLRVLHPGEIFVDVGANVGYYTVLASRVVGAGGLVVAIEPAVRNLCLLSRHLRLNNCRNVSIITAACAQNLNVYRFSPGADYAQGHLLAPGPSQPAVGGGVVVVPAVTIDVVMARTALRPHVIKIDVEGAELEVLRGAHATLTACHPTILLSVHSESLRTRCVEHLRAYDYDLKPLDDDAADATEWLAVASRT